MQKQNPHKLYHANNMFPPWVDHALSFVRNRLAPHGYTMLLTWCWSGWFDLSHDT